MYSTHNEPESIFFEELIQTLKCIMYEKLTASYSKSHLGYLNGIQ